MKPAVAVIAMLYAGGWLSVQAIGLAANVPPAYVHVSFDNTTSYSGHAPGCTAQYAALIDAYMTHVFEPREGCIQKGDQT